MKKALSAVVGIAFIIGSFLVMEALIVDANADLISFGFTGDVVSVDEAISSTFNTSQTISGSLTYESSTPDSIPLDPISGQYVGAIKALTFTVGQYTGTGKLSGGDNVIFVTPRGLIIFSNFSGENVAGTRPVFLNMGLFKDNAFPTDALPLVLPSDLQGSGRFDFFIETNPTPPLAGFDVNITSVTMISEPTIIPEPSTLLLFGPGLGALAFTRRLVRQNPPQ